MGLFKSSPNRGVPRTWDELLKKLLMRFEREDAGRPLEDQQLPIAV